jgi:hypothetical protein
MGNLTSLASPGKSAFDVCQSEKMDLSSERTLMSELIVGDTNLISGLSKTRIEALTDGIFAIAMPAHACRRGAVRGQPRMQSVLVFVPDAVSGALLNVKTMV